MCISRVQARDAGPWVVSLFERRLSCHGGGREREIIMCIVLLFVDCLIVWRFWLTGSLFGCFVGCVFVYLVGCVFV